MSLTPNTDSPFTYVPVPNEHVTAVMTYLAGLLSARPVSPRATPPSATVVAASVDDWSDEELRAFLGAETKTADIVGKLLTHLATMPGESGALSTSEIADLLGLTYSQIKVLPTQISRTLGKHFPGKGSPLTHKWGAEFSPARSGELYYYVTPERAGQVDRLTQ